MPWHQSLGEKRCGSVFASREKRRGCCVPVEKVCVVRETESEGRAAARAMSLPMHGPWFLEEKRCRGTCCRSTWGTMFSLNARQRPQSRKTSSP